MLMLSLRIVMLINQKQNTRENALKKGIFTISIDYEFAWGYADHHLRHEDRTRILGEVKIVKRLLALFDKYDIPATWAIVGHLLEKNCSFFEGHLPHPEYPRPVHGRDDADWFSNHPGAGDISSPLWFDSLGLINEITESAVSHEIASHSYAHIMYGATDVNEGAVKSDIKNTERIHSENNLPMNTFIFPRNMEGFHDLLKEAGISYFRGTTKKWYSALPSVLKRLGHYIDNFLPISKTVLPKKHVSGLIDVPDSMLLIGRNGLRRIIPESITIQKAIKGLHHAAKHNRVFHLWFHPSNFSYDTETQFEVLETILKKAADLREDNLIDIKTIDGVGGLWS
jgi:peptidoglycan/xylan/chitin deacetylase (PgdA/CDA1 family)